MKIVEGQGLDHFVELAGQAGFAVADQRMDKGWFQLELKKKA